MAKYSDYVKDEIDSEIEDASDQSEQRQEDSRGSGPELQRAREAQ